MAHDAVRRSLILCMMILFSVGLYAQTRTVSGIVKDTNGEPLIGVAVQLKDNAKTGTISDVNGKFTLTTPTNASLVFSYMGYVPQTLPASSSMTITLSEDTKKLDEVIVVGYGTMKKSDLTGSAAQIKTDALTATVAGNALESLQGKASGVAVFNNNKPGESPSIRVRGSGSISASNEPLYVVDGFPLMDGNISDINPSDIESMEVLKDASSTAIYGSRGANGVVMITTKKGVQGTKNLTVTSSVGVQIPGRLSNFIRGTDFINFMNAGYTNQGSLAPFTNDVSTYDASTNWEKEILKKSALVQDYNVVFDGSSSDTNYMLSFGYYNQEGLVAAQGYQKYSLHTNLQHKFNKWLTVGTNSQFAYTVQDIYDSALSDVSRYGWASEPVKNSDGSYNIASTHNTYLNDPWNPVLDMGQTTNQTTNNRFLTNVFAEIQLLKDLKFRANVGVDIKNSRNYQYSSSETSKNSVSGTKGSGSNTWYKNMSKVMENILTYSHTWDKKHRFSATGVYSWQDFTYENAALSGSGFENDETGAWDMTLATTSSVTWASTKYSNKLISFTGRATYAYDDKYLLTATSRWDGSSRFGSNNKWGYFPSAGFGWRATQEPFLKNNKIITDLKLRTSFGITGNQEIGNYKSLAQLVAANYTNGSSIVKGFAETIGNNDLKWERTTQWDIGFDLVLWDRLNVNVDYYRRYTNNLLYTVPIPTSSGYTSILSNVGEVSNNGWEVTFGGKILDQKDLKIDASVNLTYNKNRIEKLYGDVTEVAVKYETSGLARILKVGNSVDAVYARKSLGIIKTQEQLDWYKKTVPTTAANAKLGDEMYADINGDGTISSSDYVCLGSVQPKYFYGINLNAQYKDFGLSIYGQGGLKYASIVGAENSSANGSAWAMSYADVGSYLLYGENQISNNVYIPTEYAYKRMWSTTNTDGDYPAAGAHGVYLSDRTNANWNYFILKNIQLSYDLSSLLKFKGIKKLAINLNFQNFVTFANHRGYNPVNGDTSNPWAKSILFGVNAKF
jgi:TonB-dependent starch-binding outer membrane protein SusC